MNHDRQPYETPTDAGNYSHGRHIASDAIRGFVSGLRGVFEAKRMRRNASTAQQKSIADEAYRQRMADIQERRLKIEEFSTESQVEAGAAQLKIDEDKAARETAETERLTSVRDNYSKAFKKYQDAHTQYLADPTPENENMWRSASSGLQFHGEDLGLDLSFVSESIKGLDTNQEEQRKTQAQSEIKGLTSQFNTAYTAHQNMQPGSEGYSEGYTALLHSASALNAAQETLGIDDPLVSGILEDPENMSKAEEMGKFKEQRTTTDAAFWQAYQDYVTDPKANLQAVEQAGSEVIRTLQGLGENTQAYTDILDSLRKTQTDRAKAQRDAADLAKEELSTENIAELKGVVQNAPYLDSNEKAFAVDALDSGLFKTRTDVNDHLTNLQIQKARAQYSGTDAGKAIDKIGSYEAVGANRRIMNAVSVGQPKANREFNIDYLDDVFDSKEFEELSELQKDAGALFFLQNDKAPGGEIVTRFMQATTFLQNGLASLYQEFNRITKDGTQVKHKLGRMVKVSEGVYRYVTGDITDPDVAAFDAKVGYLLTTYIRMVSGAQVTTYEEGNFKKMLVSAGNTVELNDAIFKALDDEIRGQLQGYFSRRIGQDWGEAIGDKVYHDSHDIAADMTTKTDSRMTPAAAADNPDRAQQTWDNKSEAERKTDIKAVLEEGTSREDVVTDLVSFGMTEAEANALIDSIEGEK